MVKSLQRSNFLSALVLAAALAALASCSSDEDVTTNTQPAVSTELDERTAPAATPSGVPLTGAPNDVSAVPEPTAAATADEAVSQRIDYSLAVAAYGPFNQDGQEGIGPYFFGPDEASQQAGFACYQQRVSEAVDLDALRLEAANVVGSYFNVPPEDALSARRAAADCISAEDYRMNWISAHVWGWNTYGRDRSTPELETTNPCFAPVFDSPEEFVDAVVAGSLEQGRLNEGFIGPFQCVEPTG